MSKPWTSPTIRPKTSVLGQLIHGWKVRHAAPVGRARVCGLSGYAVVTSADMVEVSGRVVDLAEGSAHIWVS